MTGTLSPGLASPAGTRSCSEKPSSLLAAEEAAAAAASPLLLDAREDFLLLAMLTSLPNPEDERVEMEPGEDETVIIVDRRWGSGAPGVGGEGATGLETSESDVAECSLDWLHVVWHFILR